MRKSRLTRKGATYHVIARINRRENIFQDRETKQLYLNVLKRAKKKYHFKIINLCIMSNHIHILIEPAQDESLSKIMQWISSVFAIYYNKINHLCGHVWYDRFKSIIIDNIRQLVNTFCYITNNPVKAGIVKNADNYELNGIIFLKKKKYEILEPPGKLLSIFI